MLVDVVITDGRRVNERLMREIEQVVVNQLSPASEVETMCNRDPLGVRHPVRVWHLRGISEFLLPRPDPNPTILLHDGKGSNDRLLGDDVLGGDLGTDTFAIKGEAVVATLNIVFDHPSRRERVAAMRTPVLECDSSSSSSSVQDNRDFTDDPTNRITTNF